MTARPSADSPEKRGDVHNVIKGGTLYGPVFMARDIYIAGPERPERLIRLPARIPDLAGREHLLTAIRERLSAEDGPTPKVAALHGLGGAGKTSIAAEYAHLHEAEFAIAWQFTAGDKTSLSADFARLGALLGASGGPLDPRDPVTSVHAVLAASPHPWLLIFDNAPDPASLRGFLPTSGPGQILVTSQHALWGPSLGIEVPVLRVDVAAEFLMRRSGDADRASAEMIAAELGGLPLALEQAGAYVEATAGTLAGYLALLGAGRTELLDRGPVPEHPASVMSTIQLAIARLRADAPLAVALLRLLACFAPEPVPVDFLLPDTGQVARLPPDVAVALRPLSGNPVVIGDAILALRRYSLVTPTAVGFAQVHRLVQAITLGQLPAGEASQWRSAAAMLISAAIPDDARSPDAWPEFAVLMPHVIAGLELTSDAMRKTAQYVGYSGNYPAARDLFGKITEAFEASPDYSPGHFSALAARQQLGHWTGLAGDAACARDLFAGLHRLRERVIGAKHPDTLATFHALARWTGQAGNPAKARDLCAQLLPVREQVLGAEHPDTLATRHNLASWTGEAGDPAKARDLVGELLLVRERVQGPGHPDTLANRHELASWTGEAGDPAKARELFAELLPDSARVQGPEHPSTLATKYELARWTGEADEPAKARDLYAELLPVRQRVQGSEHPSTLATRLELAHWMGEAGEPARARDLYAELLPVRQRVQGIEHPSTLTTCHQLARWTGEAGDPAKARDILAELLPVRQRVQGPEHPSTLTTCHQLARWTGEAGDPAKARDILAELLSIAERVLGLQHPLTSAIRRELDLWTLAAQRI